MSELTYSLEAVLNGGSLDPDELFGGFVQTAGSRLYLPPASEQRQGECKASWLNILEAIARRLSCASGVYVCRDSTDDEDEFSVSAGGVHHQGRWMEYAGEVNVGPLSRGATNYIWLDVKGAAPVAAFGTAWPAASPNVIRLATIAMPATGYWLGTIGGDLTRISGSQAVTAGLASPGVLKAVITHDSPGTVVVGRVAAGCAIGCRRVAVSTCFNGGASLMVGDAEDTARLFSAIDGELTDGPAGAFYLADLWHRYPVETEIIATYTADGSTAGEAVIYLEVLP